MYSQHAAVRVVLLSHCVHALSLPPTPSNRPSLTILECARMPKGGYGLAVAHRRYGFTIHCWSATYSNARVCLWLDVLRCASVMMCTVLWHLVFSFYFPEVFFHFRVIGATCPGTQTRFLAMDGCCYAPFVNVKKTATQRVSILNGYLPTLGGKYPGIFASVYVQLGGYPGTRLTAATRITPGTRLTVGYPSARVPVQQLGTRVPGATTTGMVELTVPHIGIIAFWIVCCRC